jgi:hypothetical protein
VCGGDTTGKQQHVADNIGKSMNQKNGACILGNLKTKWKSFLCIDLKKLVNSLMRKKKTKRINVNEAVELRKKWQIFSTLGKCWF